MISFFRGLGGASIAERRGRFSASETIRSIAARSRLSPTRLILSPAGPVLQELRRLLLGLPILHEMVGIGVSARIFSSIARASARREGS